MKTKAQFLFITIFLFLFFLFTFILFPAARTQESHKAGWKGEITTENGIKVIKNPKEPLYGEFVFDLEEDLSIGREDDENCMFYMVRGIALDNQDNIYVTDWGNHRIQKFNTNGVFLQTIGRHGQGPGEFEGIMDLKIDKLTGDIYVLDTRREIEKFDEHGDHIKKIKLEKPIMYFFLSGNKHFIALQFTVSDEEISKAICKADSNGEILESYVKVPYEMYYKREGEMVTAGNLAYAYDLILTEIENRRFVYGYSKEYELSVIDNQGNLLYKIQKDEPYKGFSASEIRKYEKHHDLPPHKPFFYSLITDSRGRIYVQRNRTRGEEFKVNREVDIFSKDGYFLYTSTIPRGTYIIKDGFLYAYVMNEDSGEELVKRHRIKNWEQIKY